MDAAQPFRTGAGGRIDRSRPIEFTWDGRRMIGFVGDTLASALMANGERLVGRSFKYHRPRGLLAAGVEEPNALVETGVGGRRTTNLRATEVELAPGLAARSLNCWPSLGLDLGEAASLVGRFVPAGFYYKTFFWPSWRLYEGPIRRAAGIGRPARTPDPDRYETRHAHCEVLVVGSGPAGLAAARAAARGGVRVILAEQDLEFGGSLLWREGAIDGAGAEAWRAATLAELEASPGVRLLARTTATSYFDHNALALVERPAAGPARERIWLVRARRVVLATGALERPLVFPGNDRPGVILATAAETYAARWGALVGRRAMLFTNNDRAYEAARTLADHGVAIAAVVDARAQPTPAPPAGTRREAGSAVVATRGHGRLAGVTVRRADGSRLEVACDALLMSGGFNPTVHLFSQSGGRLAWDAAGAMFRPGELVQAERSVGAANGSFGLAEALAEGHSAGEEAARAAGGGDRREPAPHAAAGPRLGLEPCWRVEGAKGKAFVDFQNDVTADDVALAARESFVSVELLKRYTTLGMATDQGKTSNVNGLAILGDLTGRAPAAVGTTRYRPPFTPTSVGAYGGRARAELFRALRSTPLEPWHAAHGAMLEPFSGWIRPAAYPRAGEDLEAAVRRETLAVRRAAGLFDASPLGKIEVTGPDAAWLLDRIYANAMGGLPVGRLRYGLMLNEMGVVIDDGVCARLAPESFLVGTTSGGAGRMAAWLEEWLQCEWTGRRVLVAPVTSDWSVINLAGPRAPEILRAAGCDFDPSPAAFPHMTFRPGAVAGAPARVCRVSFTGEVSYEIHVAPDAASPLWQALVTAGEPFGIAPIGVEALMRLRTEKGFIHVGVDTDGQTVPADIGWTKLAERRADFVGKRSLRWDVNRREDRLQFVGLEPLEEAPPKVGDHLQPADRSRPSVGFVTSAGFSPTLQRWVGLALVEGGRSRLGERLAIREGSAQVRIAAPGAYDPQGERLNG